MSAAEQRRWPGRAIVPVAMDLLREAASRKWFLGLGLVITAGLVTLGFSLKMDVVDGALAATSFFGHMTRTTIRSVDVALRPLYEACAYLIFYGGLLFGILSCADFAPSLLSPGRIEHLLSLPVRRWELLIGTFLGVLILAVLAALYAAGGLVFILGIKTGSWTVLPIVAAVLASLSFSGLYAVMLTVALYVRSAALSAGAGVILLILGVVAGHRTDLAPLFEAGFSRESFKAATLLLPRISSLAKACGDIAGQVPLEWHSFASMLVGLAVFALAALCIGVWRFDQKDF